MHAIRSVFTMNSSLLIKILFFAVILLAGCDSANKSESQAERTASQISKAIAEHTDKLSEMIPSTEEIQKMSGEEIDKVLRIEYHTADLRAGTSSEEIQEILDALGRDRWDCFSVVPMPDGASRLICKRRPISAVRAIFGLGAFL